MKKNKIILIRAFILLAVVLAISIGLYTMGNCFLTSARLYERNWNMSLPYDAQEEYNAETPFDFPGDGLRYTVFQVKDPGTAVINNTSKQKDIAMENEILSILDEINAKKSWYPDFFHPYIWKKLSKSDDVLYVIYDSKTLQVYFVQKIM